MAPLYHQRHPDNNCTAGGVRIMSQPNAFDEAAFNKYMDELPDLLTGEGTGPVFPDGRFSDYH